MHEIQTSMNETHFNKINKCVENNPNFTIQSSWIDDTLEQPKTSESTIESQTSTLDNEITCRINKIKLQLLVQSDSGANCNLTNDLDLLTDVHDTPDNILATCNTNDESNIISNKAGYILFRDDTGHVIRTKVYYSTDSDGTVLSPTAITKQNKDRFDGWIQYTNNDSKAGKVVLTGRSGYSNLTFHTFGTNDLWYHDPNEVIITKSTNNSTVQHDSITTTPFLHINRLSDAASYELWHQRMGHFGQRCLQTLHQHTIGVPKLRDNAFYRCPSCMTRKLCIKKPISKAKRKNTKQQHVENNN